MKSKQDIQANLDLQKSTTFKLEQDSSAQESIFSPIDDLEAEQISGGFGGRIRRPRPFIILKSSSGRA